MELSLEMGDLLGLDTLLGFAVTEGNDCFAPFVAVGGDMDGFWTLSIATILYDCLSDNISLHANLT